MEARKAVSAFFGWLLEQAIEHWPGIVVFLASNSMTALAAFTDGINKYGPVAWIGIGLLTALVLSAIYALAMKVRDPWKSYRLETVSNKKFVNERVVIDGKRFVQCHFENVTIVFNGKAPYDFFRVTSSGENYLESNNAQYQRLLSLMHGTGMLKGHMTIEP